MNADIQSNLTKREQLKLSLFIYKKPYLLLYNNKSGVSIVNQESSIRTEPWYNLSDPIWVNLVPYMDYMDR